MACSTQLGSTGLETGLLKTSAIIVTKRITTYGLDLGFRGALYHALLLAFTVAAHAGTVGCGGGVGWENGGDVSSMMWL